jgi:DNA-directed RNA polymerase subunit RPC12/RpoP
MRDIHEIGGELWCPRCGYRLRIKPRNKEFKAKLRTRDSIKRDQESRIVIL